MNRTTIGLYDPDTLEYTYEEAWIYHRALEAFGRDCLLTFAREATLSNDEFKVRRDRYGRTLSQPDILSITIA